MDGPPSDALDCTRNGFHQLTADWFAARFGQPTLPQRRAWPEIRAGRDVLITAPTGSGKTFAAFLICLDRLVARGTTAGELPDETNVVYVSPLKALSVDIHRNLDVPLHEMTALAARRGLALPAIRTAVRTGDTTAWEREQMARRPPHVLVTTPETLFIALTAERGRRALRRARTVIVDEIHALIGDKRGAHLALTLARFDDLVTQAGGAPLQRIGLSATVAPIAEVAGFLAGAGEPGGPLSRPRASIVDCGHRRPLDAAVEVPPEELGAVASTSLWEEIYDRLAALGRAHRTTLVFVNTRRLAERVAHHLAERLGPESVVAHHGSLSRRLRGAAETALKHGTLRMVVATASLELGIDVGTVDLVCLIGTPRSITLALQRIGRSGHTVQFDRNPKGRFFPTTRDELIECAALVRAMRRGVLDRLVVPRWPRDILAQQLVAMAACGDWGVDALFARVRTAHPYRDLPRDEFDAVVTMLSDGVTTDRGRAGAYLHFDRVNGVLRARRGARLAAITSGGAIPDNAQYLVVADPEGTTVGAVDEDFAVESMAGDIFLLGSSSWRIRRVEAGRVRVEDARGAPPTLPFWRGEAPGRTAELSAEVSAIRQRIADLPASGSDGFADPAVVWLMDECGLDRAGAIQAAGYVRAGRTALGAVPSARTVVAERFFDEGGGMQLVLHAPFGARINRAWGLALRKRFCRSFNFELQAAATDNGIVISLAEQHSFPLDAIFEFLQPDTVEAVLTQALLAAPMFTARWRWNASRALAVLRFAGGRKVPPPLQRMRSDDLLASVFPDQAACQENLVGEIRIPTHPLVDETIRDCLHEAMDLDGLCGFLEMLERGTLDLRAVETREPSPFSHEILNANPYAFLDDAPLEERRARAVQLRGTLPRDAGAIGALDETVIVQVAQESAVSVAGPEDLHDALLTLGVLPPADAWRRWYAALADDRRAGTVVVGGRPLWFPAERARTVEAAYPAAALDAELPAVEQPAPASAEDAAVTLLRGWLAASGPVTATELADRIVLPPDVVAAALARLEGEGQILQGRFSAAGCAVGAEIEWCNRRVLARIHRLTLKRLRREIQPVTAAEFVRFLTRWQHVAPGTQLHGTAGLVQVLTQLQGYEISAAAWERDVLPRRIAQYEPALLDELCLSGEIMWGRLSPHPAFEEPDGDPDARTRRIRPTRAAPVAIWMREADWVLAAPSQEPNQEALSHAARAVLGQLRVRGASFLRDLVRVSGHLASEVEDGLWELVAGGIVTADGFDNLRSLVDPRRRRGEGRHRRTRPRHVPGRWALLRDRPVDGPAAGDCDSAMPDIEPFARQLLARWGIVFRALVARETAAPPWRDVLEVLRDLEATGAIRGGRFVEGVGGQQFALPEAIDVLRADRRRAARDPSSDPPLRVAAADPLNLVGIVTPGSRISALSGLTVDVLAGGASEP